MNKIKMELLKSIRAFLGQVDEADAASKVWSDKELNISDKNVGGKVEIIGSDGTLSTAPDGDYQMEDGSHFSVKDGLITEYADDAKQEDKKEKESEGSPVVSNTGDVAMEDEEEMKDDQKSEDPASEDPNQDDDAEDDSAIEDQQNQSIQDLQTRVAALESAIQQLMESITSAQAQQSEEAKAFTKQVEDLNSNLKALVKIPAEFSKTSNTPKVKDNRDEKIKELSRIMASINK